MRNTGRILIFSSGALLLLLFISSFAFSSETSYGVVATSTQKVVKQEPISVKHLKTPEPLKGVYMTSCVASAPTLRQKLVKLIDETEINAVVVDIKDATGVVSFNTGDSEIDTLGASTKAGCSVSDMKDFLKELHEKNIYVIGRLAVFQDPLYTKAHPELAVKTKSGAVWKDRKGLSFVDVGAKPFWDYIIKIAKSSYDIGFDEINFDYIRYPSDGNMEDTSFTHSYPFSKKEMLRKFFEYLDEKLKDTNIVTSADIFGMTTTNRDDLGIGQVLEYALENFDYVAPMVYPSHYPPNFNGWKDPNKVPYDLIKYVMGSALDRSNSLFKEVSATSTLVNGTTTPKAQDKYLMKRIKPTQLRPWLQDNDYPVPYTAAMVRAQIQATYDVGLTSWMLWDPRNEYTREALIPDAAPVRP